MVSFLTSLFDTSGFSARWHCGNWSEAHGWLHILSDGAIFGAYFAIPLVLMYFLLRRKDVPFLPIFWLFAAFILCCGIGHAIEASLFWQPWYRFAGIVKLLTAIVSWATVIALVPTMPKALALPGLAKVNAQLAQEIIERERAEDARRKLEAQIQQTQKLESLGVLAGGIAHDFNNLLTAILGYSELAKMELHPDSPCLRHIDATIKGTLRAAELTNQMLAYSGKGRFVIEPLNLTELVEDMSRLLQVSISKKCELHYDFAPNLPAIEADAPQMRQIVMNLLINASEAVGEQGGMLRITTNVMHCDRAYLAQTYLNENLAEGQYAYLEVADTGRGMSPETLSRVFDPFFTTKFTGRGLGLAAVLGIVRGHGGAIKVESELGKGSVFRVLFPATNLQPSQSMPRQSAHSTWKASGTILVVDDDQPVREMTARLLKRMGFAVMLAADGHEAVDLFERESANITLVLLDMTMPRMNGEEAFIQMQRLRGSVKVILCSGYNEQTATNRFVGLGLAGFIQKPYSYDTLVAALRKVLEN